MIILNKLQYQTLNSFKECLIGKDIDKTSIEVLLSELSTARDLERFGLIKLNIYKAKNPTAWQYWRGEGKIPINTIKITPAGLAF